MMFRFIFILIFFIILAILVQSSLSADKHFEACVPKDCGNGLNISFPFWIPDKHEAYCGHPNFEITCSDDKPILSISNDKYTVRKIFYHNQSFLLSNTDVLDDTCPIPQHNQSNIPSQFKLGSNNINLDFFYNCTSEPDYPTYPISCGTNMNTSRHSFFAYLREEGLHYVNASKEGCDSMISAAVDMEGMDYDNFIDTSYLELLRRGFLLEWTTNHCNKCEGSGGHCGFENNDFVCFCRDRPCSRICSKRSNQWMILGIATGIGGIGTIVIVGIIICYCLRRKPHTARKAESAKAVEAFLKDCALLTPKRYKYKDVKKMTSAMKDKIGEGGYGSVFKGMLPDGNMVAVKILSETKGNGNEFINEVASISRTSHVNIVTLIGFCVDEPKRALVYEFMPNGSLEKFIFEGTPSKTNHQLRWETLYKIAFGIARGLEYLHRGCGTRIVHFDIKPHNILLDKNFNPKIADFGLSKLCHATESVVSMTRARGTRGYIAPEVVSRNFGVVSHKSDVYSYGMMVLEMVGGRRNLDARVSNISEIYFPHWVYKRLNLNEDLSLHGIISLEDQEIAQKMILVGLWCIQIDPQNRPPMSKVLDMLAGRLEDLEIPPNPFPSSPLREEEES